MSSIDYVQQHASEVSTLLYNLLIPRLNETLFELQRELNFPIDPAPYTGQFQIKKTNSVFGTIRTYNVTISEHQNYLVAATPHSSSTTEIRYIGETLVFRARSRYPGASCFMERSGTLANMYFDPPRKDNLSHGFHIPQWEVVAKRVKAMSDSYADESENNMEEFMFNPFKSAML